MLSEIREFREIKENVKLTNFFRLPIKTRKIAFKQMRARLAKIYKAGEYSAYFPVLEILA